MLLVSRWDDNDATDGALAALVEALLSTVAPPAADRSADVRPLVAEAARALAAAGHGSTAWQGVQQSSVPVHNAEEILLPDDDDVEGDVDGDAMDSSERRTVDVGSTAGGAAMPDHAHITNGVAGCRLHELGADELHSDQRPSTACMADLDSTESDTQSRTKHDSDDPAATKPKKARWLKAAERNKSRKKAKVIDVEHAVAMPC